MELRIMDMGCERSLGLADLKKVAAWTGCMSVCNGWVESEIVNEIKDVRRFAAPRAGLARFEAFEGFEAFEAFERSIRQFRASRKRKPWHATAAVFGTRKGTTSLATASSSAYSKSRFGTFQGPSFRSSKSRFGTFRGFWRVWGFWSFWKEHPAVSGQ